MMTKPLRVSIITPCFNHAPFVEQTIRSVLNQTWPHIEYIVIDGGSTDGSVDIIRKYQSQLAHWTSEKDAGQSDAINKGFRRATGDIVAWLNSDDLYFPDAVENTVSAFAQNDRTVLTYGHAAFIDEQGSFKRYFTEIESFNDWRLRNCADFIMQPTTFFRRHALENAGYLDISRHYCMDWDLWCRLAQQGNVQFLDRFIAANREHGQTKTLTGADRRLREVRQIQREHGSSPWPHAWFSYAVKEQRRQAGQSESPFGKYAHNAAACALAGGAWRNYLHAWRNRQPIGGLTHCTHRCAADVRLTFPLQTAATTLALTFHNKANTRTLHAKFNQTPCADQSLPPGIHTIQYPIPPAAHEQGFVDLHLHISGECNLFLHKVELHSE